MRQHSALPSDGALASDDALPSGGRASRRSLRMLALALASALAASLLGVAAVAPASADASGVTVRIDEAGFSTTGAWSSSALTGPDGAPSTYASGSSGQTATWRLPAPAAGVYRVEVAIPANPSSDRRASYRAVGGAGAPVTAMVDQVTSGGQWAPIGLVDLAAGEEAVLTLTRIGDGGPNTRAASARLVPDEGTVPPPVSAGLPYADAHADGLDGWTAIGSSDLGVWAPGTGEEFDYLHVANLSSGSGSYIRPTAEIELPDQYRIATSMLITSTTGTVSLLTDMLSPYSATANNTAIQFAAGGMRIARPNAGLRICDGFSPVTLGEWFQLEIVRAGGVIAVSVNSELVASVDAGIQGGTIAFGSYKSDVGFGGIGIEELDAVPDGHPEEATGCSWTPSTGAGSAQPVLINQTGYDLGGAKRFTAPNALDGEEFRIVDADDAVVYTGTIAGQAGDFGDFDPASTGPYRILVTGDAGEGESYEFGIGANWTERISYDHAIEFMTDVRCFFGELSGKPLNGTHAQCMRGLGWRDSHQMSFELPALVDLYLANPSAIGAITVPDAVYEGIQYPTAEGSPEVARLIAWGAEIYLRGQYDHALMKEQLASFLWAYPALAEWIPVELYEDVRDYLFPIWDEPAYSRYFWHDYTAHTADLTQVYTQIGTGKGEFPVGHSIIPNLRMWQVAEREGRADADVYLNAAIAQAQWIVDNVDVSDPLVTKGQRQGEYHLMTALGTVGMMVPTAQQPTGLAAFAERWADVAIERSANMWDFHRYSDDRWTIPSFTGGGTGEDPNESGNVLGFPAAALAASTLIDDDATVARLAEIAQAQIDNVFGRNPTGRAAQFRVHDPEVAFEGLDLGWFSEYQGGYGLLQGSHGVFDGSPKNGHYPFNPGVPNIGHTEGWVTFNTAWLESLAWRAFDATSVELSAASVAADGTVRVTLRAPLNMDAAGGNTGQVAVSVGGAAAVPVTVTQTGVNALDYTAELDLAALGAVAGDTVTVSYGLGSFERSASLTVTAVDDGEPGDGEPGDGEPGDGEPGDGDDGSSAPSTTPSIVDPADADPAAELDESSFRMQDGTLFAELGAASAGEWFYAVVHSDPVRLGWFQADATGRVTVPVPSGLPAGAHTLQLYDASGNLVAWGGFSLAATGDDGLAATGMTIGTIALSTLLAGLLLLGGMALVARRRNPEANA